MNSKLQEILDELSSVLSGKTIDAILPPIVYVIVNAIFGLLPAVIAAILMGLLLGVFRIAKGQKWVYALGGLLAVGVAAGLALLTQNAASYFIPAMVSSGLLLLGAVITNLVGKPLAAWTSHLTRSWPLDWYWRKDVLPAYREVTWIWGLFFAMRLAVQYTLFSQGQAATLGWANTLLGWPVTILVLVLSYIYGIWRLRKLGGPGVEEFESGSQPPWQGQTRGF